MEHHIPISANLTFAEPPLVRSHPLLSSPANNFSSRPHRTMITSFNDFWGKYQSTDVFQLNTDSSSPASRSRAVAPGLEQRQLALVSRRDKQAAAGCKRG